PGRSTASPSNIPRPDPRPACHPELPRWLHRDLPPPSRRCARRALRGGGGALLWTTWTIPSAEAKDSHLTTLQQITTDLERHRHLGDEDGLDLLREIRSGFDVPVIIITGHRRDEI